MISFPYPKLCTANMQVDQGAGYIVCSVEAARAAGVPEERWVFPLAGADAHDHWFISHRPELHRSPAIRLAAGAAFALAGVGPDDLGPIDLYSCFPAAVQMAAREIGLPVDDPGRPLTLTGGLTFGGGPGQQLHLARHRPARRRAARRARGGGPGHRARVVRHQALHRRVREPAPRRRGAPRFRLARRAARSGPAPPVHGGLGGHRPGAGRDLHGDLRPRGQARAGHRGLPHRRRQPGLGQHRRPRHAGPALHRGGHRPHGHVGGRRRAQLD